MSRKNKFHLFTALYRFFNFLADKSGGWRWFVKPKILFGSLIIGMGSTSLLFAQVPIVKQKVKSQSQITTDTISQEEIEEDVTIETMCFVMIENLPEYPGGNSQLKKFIDSELVYPKEAIEKKIEGVVFCSFVVDRDGSTTDIEVIGGVHPLLDEEAIRVISSMPKWSPGNQRGKKVRVRLTLPIRFELKESQKISKPSTT